MIGHLPLLFAFLAPFAHSHASPGASVAATTAATPCSADWYRWVDRNVSTRDAQQHGPDIGSDEWKSTIEFHLGVRGRTDLPTRDSQAWCRAIDPLVRKRVADAERRRDPMPSNVAGPSFACDKARPGSIEAMVCRDPALSALDRRLGEVYAAAYRKADARMRPQLRAEQRGWIKGRDDCWKSDDQPACVNSAYLQRIAELQARYRLVPSQGPRFYACDGNPANEVVATFFDTRPRTLIAERGDRTSLMFAESPAIYRGRNERFVERGNLATITWGHDAAPMHCTIRQE